MTNDKLLKTIYIEANRAFKYDHTYAINLFKILPIAYQLSKFTIFLGALGFSKLSPPLQTFRADIHRKNLRPTWLLLLVFFPGEIFILFGYVLTVIWLEQQIGDVIAYVLSFFFIITILWLFIASEIILLPYRKK